MTYAKGRCLTHNRLYDETCSECASDLEDELELAEEEIVTLKKRITELDKQLAESKAKNDETLEAWDLSLEQHHKRHIEAEEQNTALQTENTKLVFRVRLREKELK